MTENLYEPILRKINDWIYYDDNCPDFSTNKNEYEEFRSKHDLDCILTHGNLHADTIFSLWLPLRFALVRINGYKKLNFYGDINFKIPFLKAINNIETLKKLLPSDNDTVIKLSRLFALGQQRCNVMILRNRAMQFKDYDYMPYFLYECFNDGKFSKYFKDDSDLVDWINSEKLSVLFDGTISRDNLKYLSGTGDIKNNVPEDMNILLDNYISLLEERNKLLSNEAVDSSAVDFLKVVNSIAEKPF